MTEHAAERAEAPEADSEAHLGHRERRVAEEFLGALDAAALEVAVRRLPEGLLEAPNEVRPRRVRLAGERRNVERLREVPVDEILRPA